MTTPDAAPRKILRIVFLLSGAGRTLQNLLDEIAKGTLPAQIVLVVSSNPGAIGLARARAARIPVAVLDRALFADGNAFNEALTRQIDTAQAHLVCMGGFLHLWRFPPAYEGRVLNIHPSLLPKFGGKRMYGLKVHEAVLAARDKETGCTVHFCDLEYDHGPILIQRRIPVRANDTPESLAERVFNEERIAYPEAIRALAEGRARWDKGGVVWRAAPPEGKGAAPDKNK